MRDSRLGSYGVLALLLTLGLRAGALAEIARPGAAALALAAAAAGAAACGIAALARARLGGYTGDVLGAAQQAAEAAMLVAAACLA